MSDLTDPYRDQKLACPACNAPLRAFQTRLACDACQGMMVSLEDLSRAIHEMTSVVPTFELKDAAPGKRACPHCSKTMSTCKIRVVIEDEVEKPRPVLDHCEQHGLWFDDEELAKVFEKVAGKGFGGGVAKIGRATGGGTGKSGSYGWKGHHGVPEWWRGGGGGKW